MRRNITKATVKSFIRNHHDVLYFKILEESEPNTFDLDPNGFTKSIVMDYDQYTLGVPGLRLEGSGKDRFYFYYDGTYEGYVYRNRHECGVIAVKASLRME